MASRRPVMSTAEILALPVSFDLRTAGRAWGLGDSKSYELNRDGEFPCRVHRLGREWVVTKADLLDALGLTADFMAQVARLIEQNSADAA